MTEEIKLKTGKKTIKIGMTDQKLSAHAGQATFWGFLHLRKFRQALSGTLQFAITSPNALKPVEIALGFITGVPAWDRFYESHPNPTREELLRQAALIDREFGSFFLPRNPL